MSSRTNRTSARRDASRKSTSTSAPALTQQPKPHQASPPPSAPTTSASAPRPPQPAPPQTTAPDLSGLNPNLVAATAPVQKPKVRLKLKLVVKGEEITAQSRQEQADQQDGKGGGQPKGQGESGSGTGGSKLGFGVGEAKGKERERENPGTICVSTLIREHDIVAMPSLEAPLTRKRRRGSGVGSLEDAAGGHIGTRSRGGYVMGSHKGKRKERKERKKEPLVNGDSSSSAVSTKPNLKAEKLVNGVSNGSPPKTSSNPNEKRNGIQKKQIQNKDKDTKLVKKESKEDREKALERNIDNVVFGDVTFKAWYPSWYPKEIIGEKALNCTGDGKGPGITVKELYVCRRCFGYSKVLVEWVRHCRCCEREVPGRRIYTHGKSVDEGGWSVWEVDGGVETLFCQNLSLFAKLFLDNKSVFFDVSGFNYFLLVHTSTTTHESQIIGFFSKEKMSWDNNNLACILIFPPWQRKGLGALLMGVSYAIAKREGIMGGPEKPISDLGKKGYKRYWSAEIARWLLGVRETDRKKGKGMVDIEKISKETWIAPEDCLAVLREMGVVEKAGRGKGTVERVRVDKVRIREWVEREKSSLDRIVDDEGFVEGYALKETAEEQEDGDDEEEEEELGTLNDKLSEDACIRFRSLATMHGEGRT